MRSLSMLPRAAFYLAAVCLLVERSSASAQDVYPEPYDGIKAMADSYSRAESQRRYDIRRQIEWNDASRVRLGIPPHFDNTVAYVPLTTGPPAGYGSPYGFGDGFGYGYDYGYGTGGYTTTRLGLFGRVARKFVWFPPRPRTDRSYLALFPFYTPTPQSIGQRQVQTGPNRWESHPVYTPAERTESALPVVSSPAAETAPVVGGREF